MTYTAEEQSDSRKHRLTLKLSLMARGLIKDRIVIGYLSNTSLSLGTRLAGARHICADKNLLMTDEELINLLYEFGMLTHDEYKVCEIVGVENFMQYASNDYQSVKEEPISQDTERTYYEKIRRDADERSRLDAQLEKYPALTSLRADAALARENAQARKAAADATPDMDEVKRKKTEAIAKAREWLIKSNAARNAPP